MKVHTKTVLINIFITFVGGCIFYYMYSDIINKMLSQGSFIGILFVMLLFYAYTIYGAVRSKSYDNQEIGDWESAYLFITYVTNVLIMVVLFALTSSYIENVKAGEEYSKCTLIEENINNGVFSANTNKIKCNSTIINVDMEKYNSGIKEYNHFKTTN
ncbi:hypothetical protein ABN362_22335 [Providencia alcalifaciens]|uniref:hypothetical protein n=1 Tax=Providencia alcalifaciens TaxID=126385 RepID=UPI0032DA900A